MRMCIIGYGTTARSHARLFRQEGVEVDSVVGRLPGPTSEFAHELGDCFATTRLSEALARPNVDAVIVCSPSEAHAKQVEEALNAEKHVLCEIPLATSFPDASRLATLARAQQCVLMVAHTHRYQPAVQMAKRMLDDGQFALHHVISRYVFIRRENVDWTGRKRSWTDNLIWHHGCHATDMCLWLLGVDQPSAVDVTAQVALPDSHMGIPLDLSILMRTQQDQLASVNMSYNSHLSLYDYLLIGTDTSLLIGEGKLRGNNGLLFDPANAPVYDESAALRQNREFLAAIHEQRQASISAESVLPAMWVLQQVQDTADRAPKGLLHPIL
jgi:2-hydroxy-4-carboxymuconate semialdehyde hemiacetal dehydrogenase